MKVFAALIAILTLGIIGYFVYQYTMGAEGTPVEVTDTPMPMIEEIPTPPAPTKVDTPLAEEVVKEAGFGPLPELDSSDAYLDSLFEETEGWRGLANSKHMIRRAVTAVDLMSRGENPNSQWNFLQPTSAFKTVEKDGRILISEENYRRYQPVFQLLDKVPADRVALIYKHLYPLCLAAYEELGNGDHSFAEKFDSVLQRILDFEPPQGDIEIVGKERTFIFADPELEASSALEKALIRIGPQQTHLLQEKIEAFRAALTQKTE